MGAVELANKLPFVSQLNGPRSVKFGTLQNSNHTCS
jgi:hypothetical protein